jgi:acyl carrier protein
MTARDRVIATFCEKSGVDPSQITDKTLVTDLGIDSMSFMDLVMRLEQSENIVLSDEEYDRIIAATLVSEIVDIFGSARVA